MRFSDLTEEQRAAFDHAAEIYSRENPRVTGEQLFALRVQELVNTITRAHEAQQAGEMIAAFEKASPEVRQRARDVLEGKEISQRR